MTRIKLMRLITSLIVIVSTLLACSPPSAVTAEPVGPKQEIVEGWRFFADPPGPMPGTYRGWDHQPFLVGKTMPCGERFQVGFRLNQISLEEATIEMVSQVEKVGEEQTIWTQVYGEQENVDVPHGTVVISVTKDEKGATLKIQYDGNKFTAHHSPIGFADCP